MSRASEGARRGDRGEPERFGRSRRPAADAKLAAVGVEEDGAVRAGAPQSSGRPLSTLAEWGPIRELVLARGGWACQACGSCTRLDVHHVLKRAQRGSDFDLDRLGVLCRACHGASDRQSTNVGMDPKDLNRLFIGFVEPEDLGDHFIDVVNNTDVRYARAVTVTGMFVGQSDRLRR